MRRVLTLWSLLVTVVSVARAQRTVRIDDADRGPAASAVRQVLAAPHVVLIARDTGVLPLRRDTTYDRSVIVLGRGVTVASTVHGDVVVVGGDLWLHPGARVDGSVIAVGGGAYNSTLARVGGERLSFRDRTLVGRQIGTTLVLHEEELPGRRDENGRGVASLALAAASAFRLPTYDRVNGLSLPWGPGFGDDTSAAQVQATVTYRSHLGRVDPALFARARLASDVSITARAERATLSNDRWIRSDLVNSLAFLVRGADTRNYYRADRAVLRLVRTRASESRTLAASVGVATERARSAGSPVVATSVPWTLLERDSAGSRRPNPAIRPGTITAIVADARGLWSTEGISSDLSIALEVPLAAPAGARFAQATLHGNVTFPTFRDQRFVFAGHAIVTAGDTAPRQRFGYLGGSGTIPTVERLALGGDHLLFVDARYEVPLDPVRLPLIGAPVLGLTYIAGAAGAGSLPSLVQNIGVRLGVGPLRAEYLVDPVTRASRLSFSIATLRSPPAS